MPTDNRFLTAPETAHALRKSVRTIHRMAAAGELPIAHKLPGPNGAFLFDRAAVEALIERRRTA